MTTASRLSSKSALVLGLIAEGHSYAQIVEGNHGITYLNIFEAAEEALTLLESTAEGTDRLAEIKHRHPRAYDRWTDEEDRRLTELFNGGETVALLAERFQRQPSAIRSRLSRLGLNEPQAQG